MPNPAQFLTVLFYGDSRAADWPPLALPGLLFVNRGIPGQTSSEALHRWTSYAAPLHPDIIVLQIGINDLTAVSFFPEETANLVVQCQVTTYLIRENLIYHNSNSFLTENQQSWATIKGSFD